MRWIDVGRTFNEHGEPLVVSDGPISVTVERMEEILATYRSTLPAQCTCAEDTKRSLANLTGYEQWVRHYHKAKKRNLL